MSSTSAAAIAAVAAANALLLGDDDDAPRLTQPTRLSQPTPSVAVVTAANENFANFIRRELVAAGVESESDRALYTDAESMSVFEKAFTHESIDIDENYEVLEYEGDGYLKAVLSSYIVRRWPMFSKAASARRLASLDGGGGETSSEPRRGGGGRRDKKEGIYSKIRILLESHGTLSTIAQSRGFLLYARGDEKTLTANRNDLLEDIFEAFIGALANVIDAKLGVGRGFYYVRRYICEALDSSTFVRNLRLTYETLVDPISRLNELLSSSRYKRARDGSYPPKLNWIRARETSMKDYKRAQLWMTVARDAPPPIVYIVPPPPPPSEYSPDRPSEAATSAPSTSTWEVARLDGMIYYSTRYKLPMLFDGYTWIRACDARRKYRTVYPIYPLAADPNVLVAVADIQPTGDGAEHHHHHHAQRQRTSDESSGGGGDSDDAARLIQLTAIAARSGAVVAVAPRAAPMAPVTHAVVLSGFGGKISEEPIGQGFSSNSTLAMQSAAEQALNYMKTLGYEHQPPPIYDVDESSGGGGGGGGGESGTRIVISGGGRGVTVHGADQPTTVASTSTSTSTSTTSFGARNAALQRGGGRGYSARGGGMASRPSYSPATPVVATSYSSAPATYTASSSSLASQYQRYQTPQQTGSGSGSQPQMHPSRQAAIVSHNESNRGGGHKRPRTGGPQRPIGALDPTAPVMPPREWYP